MTLQKIPNDYLKDDAKTFSMTVRLADPTVDTHPIKLYFPTDARILRVTSQTRSGTGTDTVTFSIDVMGTTLTDYEDLVSTASSGVQTATGSDTSANDIDEGEVLEVDVTALGGSGHNYFDIEVQGVLR